MLTIVNNDFQIILAIEVAVEDGCHERVGGEFGNIDFNKSDLRDFEFELLSEIMFGQLRFSKNVELNNKVNKKVLFMFHDMNIYDL